MDNLLAQSTKGCGFFTSTCANQDWGALRRRLEIYADKPLGAKPFLSALQVFGSAAAPV